MSDGRSCPSCGTENKNDARFCGRCGTSLAAAVAAVPAPVAASPQRAMQQTMAAAAFDPATLAHIQDLHARIAGEVPAPAAPPAPVAAYAPAPAPVVSGPAIPMSGGGAFAWPAHPDHVAQHAASTTQPSPVAAPPAEPSPSPTPARGAMHRTVMGPLVSPTGERGLPLSPMSAPMVAPPAASSAAPYAPSSSAAQEGAPSAQTAQAAPAYAPQVAPAYAPQAAPAYAPQVAPAYTPQVAPAYTPQVAPAYTPQVAPAYTPQAAPAYAPEESAHTHQVAPAPAYAAPAYVPPVPPAAPAYSASPPLEPAAGYDNRTMLGVDLGTAGSAAPAPEPASVPAAPEPVAPAPSPRAAPHEAAPAPAPAELPDSVSKTAETPAPVMRKGAARTMLGMQLPPGLLGGAVAAGSVPSASAASAPVAAAPAAPAHMAAAPMAPAPVTPSPDAMAHAPAAPLATPHAEAAAAPAAAAPTAAAHAQAAAAAKRAALGPSNRTMLGVATPEMKAAVEAARAQAAAPQAAPPAPVASAYATPPDASGQVYASSSGDISIAGLPTPGHKRRSGPLIGLLVVGVLLASAVAVMLGLWRMSSGGSPLAVSVAHSDADGELLRVEVPGAPAGTRVRFAGTRTGSPPEVALEGGRADFPLAAETLHVGDNPLSVDVVDPSGAAETHAVTLTLAYRVRADLGGLTATPPAIVIVVEAAPGSAAVLDGETLTLDATGRAEKRYPLDALTPTAEGVVEHVAHYTITPAGGAAVLGTLTTRVPLTTFHVDRPADSVVTDRPTLEIAGAVLPTASLTIDGAPVTVLPEGRFLSTVALGDVGERDVRLVATAPGCAPAVRTIHVRRVADLAREAASFTFDAAITYGRLEPAPQTFIGQRVMFEGRVYNVDVHDGRGVLQMLARECPGAARCPLWVNYSAAEEVVVDTWVRVLGTVAGAQQFRSTSGELRTVPSIDATFVLPLPR